MQNPPNKNWPLGTRVDFLDAWGRNPVAGRITAHYGEHEVRVEEPRGVVHTGQTWRIVDEPDLEAAALI